MKSENRKVHLFKEKLINILISTEVGVLTKPPVSDGGLWSMCFWTSYHIENMIEREIRFGVNNEIS